ncbi:GntR family transcriptional regulator [Streptomyces antibioticus]|uniref:GntR family transcriptional regulator n=2 Tax=Streptomyces antibioticus TaxID=1890 RepID=UPI0033B386F7
MPSRAAAASAPSPAATPPHSVQPTPKASTLDRPAPKASTLEQRVTDLLTSQVLDLRLAPGEHIVADTLAAALGVSRLPVREALRNLAGRGLVELQPHRGAFIPRLGVEQLDEIVQVFEARARLEPWAAERAAQCHDAEQLARLDACLRQGFEALDQRNRGAVNRAHGHYLRTLLAMARHSVLTELLEPLQYRTMLAFVSIVIVAEPEGWRSHQIIRDAIARRDGEAAAAEMYDHLTQVIKALRTPDNVEPSAIDRRRKRAGTGRRPPSRGLASMRLENEDGDR